MAFDGLTAVTTRVTRDGPWRWKAWCLCRCADDPATDTWFWIRNAWTSRGAWNAARGFVLAQRDNIGRPGGPTVLRNHVTVSLDGRVLARSVADTISTQNARG